MKFNEKLIELRKKQGLSQEELAQKLNVTRQTISKWELGETTPEMSKLSELSKLFGMSVDDLLNEEQEVKIEDEKVVNNEKRNKRIVLIIVGVLVGLSLIGLLIFGYLFSMPVRFFNKARKGPEKIYEEGQKIVEKIYEEGEKEQNELQEDFLRERIMQENINKSYVTSTLEMYNGTQYGTSVKSSIDEVVTNNKKYKDQVITVIYQGKSITEPKEIQKLKSNFDDMTEYEVSYEYNDQGQIYQMEISE